MILIQYLKGINGDIQEHKVHKVQEVLSQTHLEKKLHGPWVNSIYPKKSFPFRITSIRECICFFKPASFWFGNVDNINFFSDHETDDPGITKRCSQNAANHLTYGTLRTAFSNGI